MPIGGSFQLLTKMTSASSADSYEYLNGHLQSSEVFSPTSNMPLPFSLPDNNASDGHTRENLQNTSRTNAASGEISVSGSPQRSEPVQQHAHFNQVVTEHVDILRDTMRSPTHCSCNAAVYFDEMTSASGYRGSVSPAIKINQSIKRHTEIRVSNFSPVSQGSASSGESHLSKSSFDIVTQVAIIEAACRMSADIEQGGSRDIPQPIDTEFASENQLTVIPAKKNANDKGGPPLGQLFKPDCEEQTIDKSSSGEFSNVEESYVTQTRSQTGVIDVFTHLFDDGSTH